MSPGPGARDAGTGALAVDGGAPVRSTMLPYGRQHIDDDDVAAVVEVLRSDWLTTGPQVEQFERDFCAFTGAAHAVAVNSGTAALHAACHAADIGPTDEVIVPAMTFAASANCVVYQGGTPVFADVDAATLLIDPDSVRGRVTPRTRAIIAVDYGGQPCDYGALREVAREHDLLLIADACHSIGATHGSERVGTLGDLNCFSFHPVKHMTTGEGGMVATSGDAAAESMRRFRNHGISSDHRQREQSGSWFYEMVELGYNYRITDIQCALGRSQLRKVPEWLARRRAIAAAYDDALAGLAGIEPLSVRDGATHAWHLYVVRVAGDRGRAFQALRAEGIGVNVHYVPVHLHPFYRQNFGTGPGLCPAAERAYEQVLSLPMFPAMTDADVGSVIEAVHKVMRRA